MQSKCTTACSGTTCAVTGLSATGSNNLLVITVIADVAQATFRVTSISAGGTFTQCSNCHIENSSPGNGNVDAGYVLSSNSGVTSITVTATSSTNWDACISEFSSTLGNIALDSGATSSNTGNINNAAPVSPNLTLSGNNDVAFTGANWSGNFTGASSPYFSPAQPNGDGIAISTNTTSGTGASWLPTTSASGAFFSIAFQETSTAIKNSALKIMGKTILQGKATIQ